MEEGWIGPEDSGFDPTHHTPLRCISDVLLWVRDVLGLACLHGPAFPAMLVDLFTPCHSNTSSRPQIPLGRALIREHRPLRNTGRIYEGVRRTRLLLIPRVSVPSCVRTLTELY